MTGKVKDRRLVKGESVKQFFEAIRSQYTRSSYERRLITFLTIIHMSVDEFVEEARAKPEWAQKVVLEYMLGQKERFQNKEIQASSIKSVLKPLKLLLEMNDVTGINWKKISRMMPPARRYALDRSPTIQEMRFMIANSDLRYQSILLVMASSGIRIGAWDYLDWRHVEPVREEGRVVAAKLTVYAGEAEEYISFITPEAYDRLQQYRKFREEHGEKMSEDSPLVRDKWETTGNRGWNFLGSATGPERLKSAGVKRLFEDMMWRLGFRKEKRRRHEFSIHSIRKFFKTRAEQVMKPINVETLMGHSTGISDSYYRPTDKELLDDYLSAVPLLTISETEEVRRVTQISREQLEGRLQQLEDLVSRLTTNIGQQALSQSQSHSTGTSNGSASRKVVKADEIDSYIEKGWEPVLTLPDGRVVMKEVS
jgi:integrase